MTAGMDVKIRVFAGSNQPVLSEDKEILEDLLAGCLPTTPVRKLGKPVTKGKMAVP